MRPATRSEAENGVNDVAYMTPLRVKQAINANKSSGGTGTNDYRDLENKPKINGVVLDGNKTSSELGLTGDKTYVHHQSVPASVWDITHNMDKLPSVTIVDSAGSVVMGEITYESKNKLKVTFTAEFGGSAYLN